MRATLKFASRLALCASVYFFVFLSPVSPYVRRCASACHFSLFHITYCDSTLLLFCVLMTQSLSRHAFNPLFIDLLLVSIVPGYVGHFLSPLPDLFHSVVCCRMRLVFATSFLEFARCNDPRYRIAYYSQWPVHGSFGFNPCLSLLTNPLRQSDGL